VGRVEDVLVEIGADGDGLERNIGEVDERVGRKSRLGDRVVLELEIRSDLEQRGPVWTAARAQRDSTLLVDSAIDQVPSRRTTPRRASSG
jgi:hypothetical protein